MNAIWRSARLRPATLGAALFGMLFAFGALLGASGAVSAEPRRTPVLRKGTADRHKNEVPSTAAVMHGPTMRGSAVYPAQDIPVRFSHAAHLAKGMACTKCHTDIETSTRASDYNFPTGAQCDECHGKQHPKAAKDGEARCGECHTRVSEDGVRVTAAMRAPRPMLVFNHKLHLTQGATCEDCHGDMSKVRLATTLQLPTEADCLTCHDGLKATQRCGACHPSEASGRLMTRPMDDRVLPSLVPTGDSGWGADHDLAFVEDHAGIAKANPRLCESCHDEQSCTDCHAGPIRPLRIHSGDYLATHAMDAKARTQDCQACHRTQSFCLACHERMGFGEAEESAFGVGGGLRFHPEGFSGPPGMPQSHAQAAQRNMASCTSCHTEDTCLACHATTGGTTPGLDISPHGPGFADSVRCQALEARNRRVCLKCHAPVDSALDCR